MFNEHRSSFNEHSQKNEQSSASSKLHISIVQDKKLSRNQLIRPDSIKQESDYEKKLSTLIKFYSDKTRYTDENDSFSYKLIIFNDICRRANVSHEIKLLAFFTMLKRLALNYYYSNMNTCTIILSTYDEVCFQMKNYFENVEYKKSILFKWNNLTLKSIVFSNENKFMKECLQLLIKNLRHLQHKLDSKLRSERFIHNKLINACQDVFAC